MTENSAKETDFGYRRVPLDEKQGLVDDVFHSVARRYDLMNDLMSGGMHRAWKSALVTAVNPPKSDRDFRLLDVAGGTGDIAFRVLEAGGMGTHARHQRRDARGRTRTRAETRPRPCRDLHRGQC
jgi:demethylmenaquinone methyltransferase/2-methoxy-6-polyprenyl-1,4-benzoquinol methylase